VLGAVAPIVRGVARRLGEQATLVVVADGLDRHARVGGELADGDHALATPFDQLDAPRRSSWHRRLWRLFGLALARRWGFIVPRRLVASGSGLVAQRCLVGIKRPLSCRRLPPEDLGEHGHDDTGPQCPTQRIERSATQLLKELLGPTSLRDAAGDELLALLPLLRRLPRRLDRIATALERGTLSTNVRLFADQRDARVVAALVNRAVLAFLGIGFGIVSVVLLGTN
jgi:hypothetical protein